MKKLQNNFTTPEQSKRLLELGVPADSADCYFYDWDLEDTDVHSKGGSPQIFDWLERDIKKFEERKYIKIYPCWSVGRLMEIYDICRCYEGDWDEVYGKETYIETYVSAIEEAVLDNMLDFSKLDVE